MVLHCRRVALAAALLLPLAAGCGTRLYPVRGQVTYPDGKALTEGIVVFESKDHEPTVMARGVIGPDGRYELSTYKPGDGVPAGKYRALVAPKNDPNAVDKASKPPFDPAYAAFQTSGLEFDVTAAGPNEFLIKVSKQKKQP
jgi:hypothetical protein